MAIQLWDPFREAISLGDAMNELLRESFVRPGGLLSQDGAAVIPLDVSEAGDEFTIRASLPGIKPEDMQITVQGDTLTIRGEGRSEEERKGERWLLRERRCGSFQRSVTLGTPVDSEKAQARFENGVLTLTLPKSAGTRPRSIRIGGGASRAQQQIGQEPGRN